MAGLGMICDIPECEHTGDLQLCSMWNLTCVPHVMPVPLQVVDIFRMNMDKVLERDQKLSELDNRADALQAGASQFETNAAKLKRKYWWKNCKVRNLKSC